MHAVARRPRPPGPAPSWIEIPIPPLVSEDTFALAAERLADNKRFAPRRTIEPSLVQGMVVCKKCGYALCRTSTRSSTRKIHYYRCIGSDAWRHLSGPVCDSRPIRQDLLDQVVWTEVVRLLEDPALIDAEIDAPARRGADRGPPADPHRRAAARTGAVDTNSERLLSAYQEGLVTLAQLRQRMPALQRHSRSVAAELHALELAAVDDTRYVQLAATLSGFRAKLRARAETLDVRERQQILRLLVKEVLVDANTITLRHSIPIPPADPGAHGMPPSSAGPPRGGA